MKMKITSAKSLDLLLIAMFLVLIVTLVQNSFIFKSLWTDEALSWWVASSDFSNLIARTLRFQGQSPFYFIFIWLLQQLGFSSEFALRVPSICFLSISCFFLFKISRYLFNTRTAWLSLLLFLSIDSVLVSLSARPYALALACSLASVYYFLIWINEDRSLYGYLSMLFLALSFYAHYLFIFAGVTLDLILFVTSSIKDRKKNLLILSIFFVVLCLPGFFQIKYLWEIKNTLFFLPTPTFTDVLKSIFPTILIIIFLCAYLATLIAAGNPLPEKEKLNIKSLKLVFAWSVSGPIIFYFLSLNLGHSLFAERYFLWSYPGVAILFACLLANSKNSKTTYWKISLVFILILVRSIDRSWQFEDWKAAASYLTAKKTSTILAYTGLIELERLNSDKSDIFKEYLTAPLMYYKLSNTVPVGMNTDITDIKNSNDVVFVAISKYDVNTQKYIDQMIAKRVFNQEKVYAKTQFGLVKVYEKR